MIFILLKSATTIAESWHVSIDGSHKLLHFKPLIETRPNFKLSFTSYMFNCTCMLHPCSNYINAEWSAAWVKKNLGEIMILVIKQPPARNKCLVKGWQIEFAVHEILKENGKSAVSNRSSLIFSYLHSIVWRIQLPKIKSSRKLPDNPGLFKPKKCCVFVKNLAFLTTLWFAQPYFFKRNTHKWTEGTF